MQRNGLPVRSPAGLRVISLLALIFLLSTAAQSLAASYKVGLLVPLSGERASLGLAVQNGVILAREEYNREGKDQVQLVSFDSRGNVATAVRGARYLCDQEGVWAVIGPLGNNSAMAAAIYFQAKGVTMISPTATISELTSVGPAIFRVNYSSKYQGRMIAEYAVNRLAYSTYAVLYPESNYGRGFMQGFVEKVTELGGVVLLVEGYADGTTDFQQPLERIRELTPEVLYIPAPPEDIIIIAPQIAYMRVIVQVLGNSNWGNEVALSESGLYLENAIFTLDHSPRFESLASQEFIQRYRDRFAEDPFPPWAMLGYDAMKLVLHGLSTNPASRALLPEAMSRIRNYNGAAGFLRSFNDGEPDKPIMFTTIKSGRIEIMDEELLADAKLRGEDMTRRRQVQADSLLADSLAADTLQADSLAADSLAAGSLLVNPQ